MTDDELQKEIAELRSQFKFRSYFEDLDSVYLGSNKRLLSKTNRDGRSEIITAQEFVTSVYMENEKVELLVDSTKNIQYEPKHHKSKPKHPELAKLIVKQNKPELLEKLFTSFVRKALSQYFVHLADDKILHKMVENGELGDYPIGQSTRFWKTKALTAYTDLINYLEQMKLPDRVAYYEEERQRLENEEFKKPLEKPDTRKVDNKRFWAIINESRDCLLYTSPSPRDRTRSRMPSSA